MQALRNTDVKEVSTSGLGAVEGAESPISDWTLFSET